MKAIIESIINGFAENGFVFSNEQDFQFEMATCLRNVDGVKNVKLEALSLEESWDKVIKKVERKEKLCKKVKQYYDILVEMDDGDFIAIELKYKTPQKLCFYETSQGQVVTFVQGAYDIGAYDFLEDISRLENIHERFLSNNSQNKVQKCYSVMLTNDKNYRYNHFNKKRLGKESPWKNYSIAEGKTFKKGEITFTSPDPHSYSTKKATYKSIVLKKDYDPFVWHNYNLEKYQDFEDRGGKSTEPGFSFLIVEVKPV